MTQRTGGYNGGIQRGTTASSNQSVGLEQALQEAARHLNEGGTSEHWQKAETAQDLADRLGVPSGHVVGISPDGGMWTAKDQSGRIILAAEAKKQGEKGNAIERWYKNWAVLSRLNVGVYITVCLGDGFFRGNSAQKILETAVALEVDAPTRFNENKVWNHPVGRLWIYRYEAVPPVAELQSVLASGLAQGRERLQ